eukprot:COSAG05_NODE_10439_length_565_cov_5.418675_1_plen_144_part_01
MSLYNPASPPEHASRNRQRDGSEVAAAGAGTGLGGNPTKVLDFARMIGMDLTHDSEYIWIADEMVRAELPPGWAEVAGQGGELAFLDLSTNTVSEDHPMTGYYRSLFHRHKDQHGQEEGRQHQQGGPQAEQGAQGSQAGGEGDS